MIIVSTITDMVVHITYYCHNDIVIQGMGLGFRQAPSLPQERGVPSGVLGSLRRDRPASHPGLRDLVPE